MVARARRSLKVAGPAIAVAVLISACNVTADPFEDLGELPDGTGAHAYAVNNRGEVVGIAAHPGAPGGEATKWNIATGEVTGLGTFGPGLRSGALDINDAGVAVGFGVVPSPTFPMGHAFIAEPGEPLTDINDDLGTWHDSTVTGINDDGIVVGSAVRYQSVDVPAVVATMDFAYDPSTGEVTRLPMRAVDVNDHGIVVGINGNTARTFDLATGIMTSLGSLGGGESQPQAINNDGVVVGTSKPNPGLFEPSHAFRYDPAEGVMRDLGTLGGPYSIANDVNDNGDVVGESITEARHQKPFFWWHVTKRMYDLGTIGSENLLPATSINDRNQVVGYTRSGEAIAWHTTVRFEPHDN